MSYVPEYISESSSIKYVTFDLKLEGVATKKDLEGITHVDTGICFSPPSTLGHICRPSAPRSPGPVTFLSVVFDFLTVCVIKCSCAVLVKRNCEYSIYKY